MVPILRPAASQLLAFTWEVYLGHLLSVYLAWKQLCLLYIGFAIVHPTLAAATVGFAWHRFVGLHVTEVLLVPSCALGEHWHCRTPHIIPGFH